ncbi:unnamed protein product [Fusarium venenatum]|uniref:Uncharacterized protein n=1 Tax=Fusarium venenatum TaxID=56646 RepID=A0A2L2TRH4_9HYPO|nr:uncharacterized protein FVRRES_02758 [Fusarium venenatum]CEI66246.1 unnamed protein product [Fusarium venenatum]
MLGENEDDDISYPTHRDMPGFSAPYYKKISVLRFKSPRQSNTHSSSVGDG